MFHERAFAASGAAQNDENLAGPHLKGYVLEHDEVTVGDSKIVDLNYTLVIGFHFVLNAKEIINNSKDSIDDNNSDDTADNSTCR